MHRHVVLENKAAITGSRAWRIRSYNSSRAYHRELEWLGLVVTKGYGGYFTCIGQEDVNLHSSHSYITIGEIAGTLHVGCKALVDQT